MADQVVIQQPESTPGDAAHIAAMVAKVDGQNAAPEAQPPVVDPAPAERPSWLPEKFANEAEFAKAYAELEAKQSGKPAETPPADPNAPPADPAADPVAEELTAKGLDLNEFSQEFSTSGTLSADSYTKLEAAGYPKAIVDQYIAGQQALAVSYEADVKSAAGGAEKFDEVSAWAAANLSDAEKVAYNAAVDSRNLEQAKLAVAGLTAKYNAANPPEGNLLGGRTTSTPGDSYASLAEMTKDMGSPEYNRDPAFRQRVMDKISRSKIL